MLLVLALAAVPGMLQAQSLADRYTFSSGTDPTLWIAMPATADTVLYPNTPNETGTSWNFYQASFYMGFDFVYGYHALQGLENNLFVNDDGMIRMGYQGYLTGMGSGIDPWGLIFWQNGGNWVNVVNGLGHDGLLDSISYVCTWIDTAQPNRRRVLEFMLADAAHPEKHSKYQVHLEEHTYDITIVYAATDSSNFPDSKYTIGINFGYMTGLNGIIDVSDNSVIWDLSTNTTADYPNAAGEWPTANRYYKYHYRHEVATVPYYEDFNSTIDHLSSTNQNDEVLQVLPDGWYSLCGYGSSKLTIPSLVYRRNPQIASSTPYALCLRNSGDLNTVVLPEFDVPIDSLRLDFTLSDYRLNYNYTDPSHPNYNVDGPRAFVVGLYHPDSIEFVPLDTIYSPINAWPADVTVYFNLYDSLITALGPRTRIALHTPYIQYYVDDVRVTRNDASVSCLPAKSMHVDALTTHSASISWTTYGESSNSWQVEYGLMGFSRGTGATYTVDTTSITLTSLFEGTPYDFYLWSSCGTDTLHLSFTTEASPVMALPYETGFEDGEDQAWHFDNGTNGWVVGSAAASTGNKSLYVSYDGGKHNCSSNNGDYIFASRTFHIGAAGTYRLRYDWRCYGSSWYYYMRAALVPASDTTIVAGVNPYPFAPLVNDTVPMPAGWIRAGQRFNSEYSGPDRMNIMSNWTTYEDTLRFAVQDTGLWRLVFFWMNEWHGYSYGSPMPAAVDNVWFGIETCPPVKNLEATHLTDNSATVTWEAGGSETSWTVSFDGEVVGTTSTPTYTFTGLASGSEYTASVRARCSDSDSAGLASVKFHTLECSPDALPYQQNFDSLGIADELSLPECWEYKMSDPYRDLSAGYYGTTQHPIVVKQATNAASGEYSLRLYQEAITMMPSLNEPMNSLQLDFDVKFMSGANIYSRLVVGVMEGQRFVPYDTVVFDSLNTYQHTTIYMGGYTGTGNRIAFYNEWTTTYRDYAVNQNSIHLDNIAVTLAPECVSPTRLTISRLFHNSVSFYWHGNGATTWKVEYGPAGFTPGTGMLDTVYTSACTLSGLTPATQYDCYVTPLCTVGTAPATSMTFVTRNLPVATLPYFTGFEPGEDTQWELRNGTNGWFIGEANAFASDHSLYISPDSGATCNYTNVQSYSFAMRDFVVDTPGDYTIGFDWSCGGASNDVYMRVVLIPSRFTIQDNQSNGITGNGTPEGWTNLGRCHTVWGNTIQMINHTDWEHFETTVAIDSADLDTYTLLFFWYNNSGSTLYPPPAAVDNVVFGIISCSQPSEIALDSASGTSLSFHWSDVVNANSYEIWVNDQLVGTTSGVNYTATGLQPTTEYRVMVRGICGSSDTSFFARTSLTTECDVHTLTISNPLFEDFESPAPPAMCWTTINTSVDNPLTHNTAQAYSGSRSFRFSSWEEDSYDEYSQYLISPQLSCTDSVYLSFMAQCASSGDRIRLGYSTTTPDLSSMTWESSWRRPSANNVWEEMRDTFPPNTLYIAIHYYADYMYYFYVDSLTIYSNAPDCFVPVVTDTTKTYRSIDLAWSMSDSTEIIITADSVFDYTAPTVESTTGSYSFTGLTASTTYIIGLRDMCGEELYSDWNIFTVTTDDLECLTPAAVSATPAFTSAHIAWTPAGGENTWQVHLFDDASYDTLITTSATTVDMDDMPQGWTYYVQVRPLCGDDNEIEGPWSDTTAFTTQTCEAPTDISATTTATTATISWTASPNSNGVYRINYGYTNFVSGEGTIVTVSGTSYTISDLEPETDYDVYIESVCEDGVTSVWSTLHSFTTDVRTGIADIDDANGVTLYPNPTGNRVTVSVENLTGEAAISIIDMNGCEVMHSTMNDCTKTLDVSHLSKGAYFLRLTGEHLSVIRKLMVL